MTQMKEALAIILATLRVRVAIGDLTPTQAKQEAIEALANLKALYGAQ